MAALGFVIVGTPRSGTTLVQRLASELRGVRIPPETHILAQVLEGVFRPDSFPMKGAALVRGVEHFAHLHGRDGIDLDVDAIVAALDGEAATVVDLYVAIAAAMAGPAELLGEKTPGHLLWWRPLTVALPDLKLIVVVRDPRDAVGSSLSLPFGMQWLELLAQRWVCDQDHGAAAYEQLGPGRCLVIRYEDVVTDPDEARATIARYVDRPVAPADEWPDPRSLFVDREWWKEQVPGPISADPAGSRAVTLTAEQRDVVTAICRRHLARYGYGDPPSRWWAFTTLARLSPRANARRLLFVIARRRNLRFIDCFAVTARPPLADTKD